MARLARVVLPGVWHHVTQRGNRRQTIFFNDGDRRLYLELLRRHCFKHAVVLTGYCLMSNHVHLLLVPPKETSLAVALGAAHTDYARWINLRLGETGHFWQSRYFSCPLDGAHQWEALRYVELNPVRAGLVKSAIEWPWSSAVAHLVESDTRGLVDLVDWKRRWSADTWRRTLEHGVADAALFERIREATRTGRPAGSEAFLSKAERLCGRLLRQRKRGRKVCAAAQAARSI